MAYEELTITTFFWVMMIASAIITAIAMDIKAYTLPIDDQLDAIEEALAFPSLDFSEKNSLERHRSVLLNNRADLVSKPSKSRLMAALSIGYGCFFFSVWGASGTTLLWFIMLCVLSFLAVMDVAHRLIPERFLLVLFSVGCLVCAFSSSVILIPANTSIVLLTIGIMGVLMISAIQVTKYRTGIAYADQVLGSGDVLLVFALCPWLGANVLWVVIVACVMHIFKMRQAANKTNAVSTDTGAPFVPGLLAGTLLMGVLPTSLFSLLDLNRLPLLG